MIDLSYENRIVSILIPAYSPEFYYDCILSALNQTYEFIEILVIDDSPSSEIKLITDSLSLHKNFEKIKYIKNEKNIGEINNYIKCFKEAKGEYIKFLNDDDILSHNCVEKLISFFYKYGEEVSLVTSKREIIDQNGIVLEDSFSTRKPLFEGNIRDHYLIDGIQAIDLIMTKLTNYIGEPSTTMFPKKLIENNKPSLFSINGREIFGNGDITMWVNLLFQGKLVYINETLSSFRVHSNQSQKNTEMKYFCINHWYYMLYELPKRGALKNKKTS